MPRLAPGKLTFQLGQFSFGQVRLRFLSSGSRLPGSLHAAGELGCAEDSCPGQPGPALNLAVGGDNRPIGRLGVQSGEVPADGAVGRVRLAHEADTQTAGILRLRHSRGSAVEIDRDGPACPRGESAKQGDELGLVVGIVEAEPNSGDQIVSVDEVGHTTLGFGGAQTRPGAPPL